MADTTLIPQDIHESLWRLRFRLAWRSFRGNWALFRENPVGLIGLIIILIYAVFSFAHPILMATIWDKNTYDPVIGFDRNIIRHPSSPSWIQDPDTITLRPQAWYTHILGTDPLGRDVMSQLMFSTTTAFVLGVGSALVTVVLATTTGAMAAFYGGTIDALIMRMADLILMLPFIPILIVLGALFEFQPWHLAIVFGILSGFGGQNITIKAQALTIKVRSYIDAARVAGGTNWHIIFTHIVPNLLPLAFLSMMNNVTGAIQAEAALSFLGLLNIRISWGIMLQVAQTTGYLLVSWKYWYLMLPAGLSITLLSTAFYLVGRALDEVVNPRLRRR